MKFLLLYYIFEGNSIYIFWIILYINRARFLINLCIFILFFCLLIIHISNVMQLDLLYAFYQAQT